jgi:O-antigen/teichoic acid export membrane protein
MSGLSRKVFSDNLLVMSGEVFLRAVYLFAFVIYARLLSPFELATLPVFALLSAMTAMVSNLGLPLAVVREVPRLLETDPNKALAFLRSSAVCSIIGALCFSLVALLFAPGIARLFLKDSECGYVIRLMSAGFFLYAVDLVFSYSLRALLQFRTLTIKNAVLGVSQRVLSISLFLIWGIKGLVIGIDISLALGVSFSLYVLRNSLFRKVQGYPVRDLLKFSFPYYAEGFLTFFQGQADQLIVATVLGPPILAAYYVAKRLADSVEIFKEAIDQTLTPALSKVSGLGRTTMERSFRKITTVISYFAVPLGLLAASSSFAFLYVTGKEKYLDGTSISTLLCISVIFTFYMVPVTRCIFVLAKPSDKLRLTAVQSFSFIGILLLSVNFLGVTGVALGRLTYTVGSLVYALRVLGRIMEVRINGKAIRNSLLASMTMALFVGSIQMLHFDIYIVPIIIAVGLILWLGIILVVINNDDLDLITSMLPRNRPVQYIIDRLEKRLQKNAA